MSAKKQRNIQDFFARKLPKSPAPSVANPPPKIESKGDDEPAKKLDQTIGNLQLFNQFFGFW